MEVFTIKKLGMWISILVPILLTCTSCTELNAPKQAPENSHTVQTSSESTSTEDSQAVQTSSEFTSTEDVEFFETTIFTAVSSRTTTVSSVTASSTANTTMQEGFSGIILTTTQEEYPADVKQIVCTVENPTQEKLNYGEGFMLQKLTNGEWERVPYKEGGSMFPYVIWIFPPGYKNETTFSIQGHYTLPLEPGEYRVSFAGTKSNVFEIK